MRNTSFLLLAVVTGALVAPRAAEACGGFFCQNVPVDQSGEHLLFGIEEDGTVVAHIQIQYQGAAEDFAWVLPLPANPVVGVGTDEVFRTLRQITDPRLWVEWTNPGECGYYGYYPEDDGAFGGADADADADADPGVEVLQQGPVGPYDMSVVTSDDADALMTWLTDNDYVIPESSRPAVQSYVNQDSFFLALRLQKDRSVGDLQPITVQFPEQGPCVPLRLTAIAATPDMPIYAWVLADGRAVSTNFLDVEPNWAAIDWLRGPSNYADVVRRAVDEATGHALVTEYAGAASVLTNAFWWEGRYDIDMLRDIDDPIQFVDALIGQGFSGSTELLNLLRTFIPKPDSLADVDDQDFYNCLGCYADEIAGMAFDPEAFADALLAVIVQPLIDAQALADRHPYLTRLYTAISPEEMTDDPVFRFNMDLGDVSNVHTAQATVLCDQVDREGRAPIRVTLPDGRVLFYEPADPGHPDAPGDPTPEDMPASDRALQQEEVGPGDVLYDNDDAIDAVVARDYGAPEAVEPPDGDPDPGRGEPVPHSAGGGACSASPGDEGSTALGWCGLALALALGRRRRPRAVLTAPTVEDGRAR